ncbi:thioesterase family protein [Nocardia sp. NPDC050697]|uniref:thioesterase family protein n=1 Tax=Nocardia sp. NPDC050697 TaxID=3155158 RepID=UPI0033C8D6A4
MISASALSLDRVPSGPVISHRCRVDESWIDFNDHMNAMYYGIVVYRGQEKLSELIGMGADYTERTGLGKVIVQSTLGFERELLRGDELEIRSWLLGVDSKRFHVLHEVFSLGSGYRAAVSEQLDLHFDLAGRRSCPMPATQLDYLTRFSTIQTVGGVPKGIGRTIRPPRPS